MIGRQLIQAIRRRLRRLGRTPRFRRASSLQNTAEFQQVNAVAGTESLRPALSGLRVRYPSGPSSRTILRRSPKHASTHVEPGPSSAGGTKSPGTLWVTLRTGLADIGYRWHPSAEYWRRRSELRQINHWIKQQPRRLSTLPPILFYAEEHDIAPTRVRPELDEQKRDDPLLRNDELPGEKVARLHAVRLLRPRLPSLDPEDLIASRTLLPRHYREFLRSSLYPRIVAGLIATAAMIFGILWVTQLQQAEAVAAGRFHLARHAFHAELDAARAYGLDRWMLRPLELRARKLNALRPPVGLITRARLSFYRERERDYRVMLRTIRRLERRSLRYWIWREDGAYAALAEVTDAANRAGLSATLPSIPACGTPHCYRAAVSAQVARAAWLRQTVATIGVYRAATLATPDPATTAGGELQKARSLHAVLPFWATPPARIAELDGLYATAASPDDYARVGALAHLDVDALEADLVRTLPGRAIVVSAEDQKMTLYQRGKAVYRSPVTVDSATPTGVFHIQAKQASIPALYWNRSGALYRYRYGSLTDWMPFSGEAALQAAPWRSVFGPGSDGVVPLYAPSTPGSVDLPPSAAGFLFSWASVGTEVVLY